MYIYSTRFVWFLSQNFIIMRFNPKNSKAVYFRYPVFFCSICPRLSFVCAFCLVSITIYWIAVWHTVYTVSHWLRWSFIISFVQRLTYNWIYNGVIRRICIEGIFWALFCLEENQSRQNNKSQKHIDSTKRLKISICLTESVSNRVRYFIQRHLYFEVLHFDFCLVWYLAQQWNGMSYIFFCFS